MRTLIILTVLTASLFAAAWHISPLMAHPTPREAQASPKQERKTLRDAAKERDVEVTPHLESEVEASDIRSLINQSSAIVFGEVREAESSFTESGEFIVTSYRVDVQRVLKDSTQDGAWRLLEGAAPPDPLMPSLKFVRVGGEVRVNGHRASMKVKGQDSLKKNDSYVLFLNWSPNFKAYTVSRGLSGVFLVEANSLVRPLASSEKIKLKYTGLDVEAFFTEVLKTQ